MTRDEEKRIIDRVLSGDTDAFEALVLEHQTVVYKLALRMTANPADAEDCAQEAFVKAFRSLASFRGDASFSSWLYRLTTNTCLDLLRSRKRKGEVSLTDSDDTDAEWDIPDGADSPEEFAVRKETRETVREALRKLPPDFREVLLLRELGGLSYEEIGQQMSLEAGTVKSRIFRARKKLAAILTADGNNPDAETSDEREVR